MLKTIKVAFLFILLLSIVLAVVIAKEAKERFGEVSLRARINDQIQAITTRSCLINLRGVECPDTKRSTRNMDNSLIIAGLGYDRFTHYIKPQILKSNLAQSFPSPRVESFYSYMRSERELYLMIYPPNPNNIFYNGLYAHNGNADEIFKRFFSGNFHVANSQKQYLTHNARVQSTNAITEEFSRIIEILPENYDDSIYNMMITYFGDSVLTSVEYGGVVDSTVSIRSCFSDSNIATYVQRELSNIIGIPDGYIPQGYAQYHKVSQLDIAGGNPQDDNISRRIQSFPNNPVPVRFESSPIWSVFPPGPKRENMKTVYNNYVNTKKNWVQDKITRSIILRNLETNIPYQFFAFTKKGDQYSEYGKGQAYSYNPTLVSQITYTYTGFEPIILKSPTAKNGCTSIGFPNYQSRKVDGVAVLGYMFKPDSIIVCTGCTPMLTPHALQCPPNPTCATV